MKRNDWLIVLVVVIVVAVLASLITSNLTGNTIRVSPSIYGKAEVYTKQEVDAKLVTVPTTQTILGVLNKCRYYSGTLGFNQDCNAICNNPKLWGQGEPAGTCVNSEFAYNDDSAYSRTLVRCNFAQIGRKVTCVCC
jgi:hypothetical protein